MYKKTSKYSQHRRDIGSPAESAEDHLAIHLDHIGLPRRLGKRLDEITLSDVQQRFPYLGLQCAKCGRITLVKLRVKTRRPPHRVEFMAFLRKQLCKCTCRRNQVKVWRVATKKAELAKWAHGARNRPTASTSVSPSKTRAPRSLATMPDVTDLPDLARRRRDEMEPESRTEDPREKDE